MASKNIKGITLLIGGDTTGLAKALGDVNRQTNSLQSELKQVDRLLKLDPNNTVLLAQKQELLSKSVSTTTDKLQALKKARDEAEKNGNIEKFPEQYRELQREIVSTETSLNKLEEQGKKTNAVLSKDDAINNLKNIGKTAMVAGAAVGAAFVGMGIAAVNNADELQKQADITGLTAERLQELSYIGGNLGVELDVITGAQAKLTKSMYGAQQGTKLQSDAFKALGITVLDNNGQLRDSRTVMEESITALGKMENETQRDALAMQIFGKSAMAMNPLIKAGGEELSKNDRRST